MPITMHTVGLFSLVVVVVDCCVVFSVMLFFSVLANLQNFVCQKMQVAAVAEHTKPVPVSCASLVSTAQGQIFLFGGETQENMFCSNLYTLTQDKAWQKIFHLVPKRDSHAAFMYMNNMYVFAGNVCTVKRDEAAHQLYMYNVSKSEWQSVKTQQQQPTARYQHTATLVGDCVYVFGGRLDNETFTNDMYILHLSMMNIVCLLFLETMTWKQVETNGTFPVARSGHSAVRDGNRIVIFGGIGAKKQYFNDTIEFNTTTNTFKVLVTKGTPPVPRERHVAFVYDQTMYIFGGWRYMHGACEGLQILFQFQLNTNEWGAMVCNLQGRYGHCVTVSDKGEVYIFGGRNNDFKVLNDLICWNLGANKPQTQQDAIIPEVIPAIIAPTIVEAPSTTTITTTSDAVPVAVDAPKDQLIDEQAIETQEQEYREEYVEETITNDQGKQEKRMVKKKIFINEEHGPTEQLKQKLEKQLERSESGIASAMVIPTKQQAQDEAKPEFMIARTRLRKVSINAIDKQQLDSVHDEIEKVLHK